MKFTTVLLALMAASTAFAAPHNLQRAAKGTKAVAAAKPCDKGSNAAAATAVKSSKNSKSSKNAGSSNNAASSSSSNSTSSVDSSSNSTSTDDSSSSDNSTSSSGATSTSTAASATRTRPCDQGDQSLAAGLNAAVVIGIGQQASVLTLQNISAQADFSASDFSDGVTRLQQFTDTMGLQLQMAQGIADDDSFAQTQLKLLADSQTQQDTAVKSLANIQSAADAQGAAQDLNDLLASFLASTNNAQDGAEQALIDCFLPLTAVSG